jgi:hypothetical protein
MKKFSNPKHIVIAVMMLLLGLVTSCKKLVEIPASPPNEISQTAVFADSSTVISAIAGVYSCNYQAMAGFAFRNGDLTVNTGMSGDDLAETTDTYAGNQIYLNTMTPLNGPNTLWIDLYASIYQVNVCLANIPSSTAISAALKQQLIGEMEVVRAYCYFHLVNLYGGVPLVMSTNYIANATLPKASADVVYAQIMADLIDAQKKLSATYPSAGHLRPNLYTADALLAKVYLYQGKWQNAYDMANAVVGSGLYNLEPNLNNVFLDGSQEAIWQLPTYGPYYGSAEANNFVAYSGSIPTYPVNNYLLSAFEAGDQRAQDWIGADVVNDGTTNTTYYYPNKYKYKVAASPAIEDLMLFRLGEIYLIRAEAAGQLGNTAVAISDLNIIRKRAGLLPTTATAQADVLSAVARERRTELCFEMANRWYDLKRTGTAVAVLSAEKPGWRSSPLLYPIPFAEIVADPNLVQNPGYQ